jgi:hypothetical protein
MLNIPKVWNNTAGNNAQELLMVEAANRFRQFAELPAGSVEEWEQHKRKLREMIREKAAVHYDPSLPLEFREFGKIVCKGYEIRKIVYRGRPELLVTANLYVPDGKGPFPAVIFMHGHSLIGKAEKFYQGCCHALALCGYVVLIVDSFGTAERSTGFGIREYHGSALGASLMNVGETLLGCQLADNMRGVDLLCSLPFVDASRIGATGASGGGNQTMWLAAMDDRIRAAVPVVNVGTFESYVRSCNCFCEVLPDGLTFTEESGVLALTAPRAMMICTALYDSNAAFQAAEMFRSFENARPVYRLLNVPDNFTCRIFNTKHGYYPEIREAMLGWFELHLKGQGHGCPVRSPEFQMLPEQDLLVFPTPESRLDVGSIVSFCRDRSEQLLAESRKTPVVREDKIAGLRRILHLGAPLKVISAQKLNRIDSWDRYTLTLSNQVQLPLCVRNVGKSCVLQIHPEGKKAFQPFPPDHAQAALDLSGHGENQPESDPIAPYHDFARHLIWLGYTVQGRWIGELDAVCDFLRDQLHFDGLILQGSRECAVTCLLYSVLEPKIRKLILIDMPDDCLSRTPENGKTQNLAAKIFGILKWGGLPMAEKLSGAAITKLQTEN